ncbi:hypothetical protein QJQ45_002645 [Haematococcus lacustris]|nr:hypothetical protein QJQ45_002645 [Haematococcus lacustris]
MMTDKKEGVKPPRRPGQIEEGPRVPRAGQRRAAVGMAAAARARAAQTRLDPASTAAKRTPRLATEHIAALTWAVGLLHSQGVRLDRARLLSVLDPLLASLARNRCERLRSPQLRPQTVALLLKGLAQLHHRPADGQLLPGLAAWVVDHSSSMNARDVVMVLHSCCSLGQAPPDLVNSLASRAAHIPRTFTPHAIATLLRCLATAPPDTLEGAVTLSPSPSSSSSSPSSSSSSSPSPSSSSSSPSSSSSSLSPSSSSFSLSSSSSSSSSSLSSSPSPNTPAGPLAGAVAAAGGPSPDRGSYPTGPTASAPGSLTEAATTSPEQAAGTAAAAGQGAVPVLLQGPPRPTSIPPRQAALKDLNIVPSIVACYGLGAVDGRSQSGHLHFFLEQDLSFKEALCAGIAPQLSLMQPSELGDIARALSLMGPALLRPKPSPTGSPLHPTPDASNTSPSAGRAATHTSLAPPYHPSCHPASSPTSADHPPPAAGTARLPPWLASLIQLLCDKAERDLAKLQPLQLAAVLGMSTALRQPHPGLLSAVAHGILAPLQLDSALPPVAAAAFMRALAMGESDGVRLDGDDAAMARALSSEAPRHVPRGALGPLPVTTSLPEWQRVRGHDVGRMAVSRLKQLYTAPGRLGSAGPEDLAALAEALAALGDADQQLLQAVARRAEEVLLPPTVVMVASPTPPVASADDPQLSVQLIDEGGTTSSSLAMPSVPDYSIGPEGDAEQAAMQHTVFDATQLHRLMFSIGQLGLAQGGTQLAAAAARHLHDVILSAGEATAGYQGQRRRLRPGATLPDGGVEPEVLATVVDVLHLCRQHGVDDSRAASAAARAYVSACPSAWSKLPFPSEALSVLATCDQGFSTGFKSAEEEVLPISSTASGLQPSWRVSQAQFVVERGRERVKAAHGQALAAAPLDGNRLGHLLSLCRATDTADASFMRAVAGHVLAVVPGQVLSGEVGGSRVGEDAARVPSVRAEARQLGPQALVQCFAALADHAKACASQPSKASGSVAGTGNVPVAVGRALRVLVQALPATLAMCSREDLQTVRSAIEVLRERPDPAAKAAADVEGVNMGGLLGTFSSLTSALVNKRASSAGNDEAPGAQALLVEDMDKAHLDALEKVVRSASSRH